MFSSHPKRERDREAHLNYYASTYNRGDNYRITRLKLNRHELNKHASLTKNTANVNTKQTKPRFGRLLRPPAWKYNVTEDNAGVTMVDDLVAMTNHTSTKLLYIQTG